MPSTNKYKNICIGYWDSAEQILRYSQSYEFSHLLDVTVLDDYEEAPLVVVCLNQGNTFTWKTSNKTSISVET